MQEWIKEKTPSEILQEARQWIEFASVYTEKFAEFSKKMPEEKAHEWAGEHGMDPADVQRDLKSLVEKGLVDLKTNPDIRDFMRVQALAEITSVIEGKHPNISDVQYSGLLRAQKYEKLGVLNVEEDAELFDELTK